MDSAVWATLAARGDVRNSAVGRRSSAGRQGFPSSATNFRSPNAGSSIFLLCRQSFGSQTPAVRVRRQWPCRTPHLSKPECRPASLIRKLVAGFQRRVFDFGQLLGRGWGHCTLFLREQRDAATKVDFSIREFLRWAERSRCSQFGILKVAAVTPCRYHAWQGLGVT